MTITAASLSELNSSIHSNHSNHSIQSDQSSVLGVITRNLGHDLDEIRQRSLEHLEAKLDNGLIVEDDIILNRELFVKLLDLLSTKSMRSHHERAVRILTKLMRWPSTAKNLLLLNALEILDKVKLELNEPPTLRNDVEAICKQLTDKLNEWSACSELTTNNNLSSAHSLDLFDRLARFQIQSRLARQPSVSDPDGVDSRDRTLVATPSEVSKTDRLDLTSLDHSKSIKVV